MAYESRSEIAAKGIVGQKIQRVLVEPGENVLVFETDQGDVIWEAWGDCCSETWFADILGFAALRGGKVAACENIEMDTPAKDDGRGRQYCDSFYGVKITTDKGICDIVYRNSSNGYYGGEIGVSSRRPKELVEITDDWQAQAPA